MKNFLAHSHDETFTAPLALAAGAGALIGATFGVSKLALAQGARGPFTLVGKFELPKDANAAGEGARAYWDNAARVVTTTAAGNTLIGVFTSARLAADPAAHVRLNGSF